MSKLEKIIKSFIAALVGAACGFKLASLGLMIIAIMIGPGQGFLGLLMGICYLPIFGVFIVVGAIFFSGPYFDKNKWKIDKMLIVFIMAILLTAYTFYIEPLIGNVVQKYVD